MEIKASKIILVSQFFIYDCVPRSIINFDGQEHFFKYWSMWKICTQNCLFDHLKIIMVARLIFSICFIKHFIFPGQAAPFVD